MVETRVIYEYTHMYINDSDLSPKSRWNAGNSVHTCSWFPVSYSIR